MRLLTGGLKDCKDMNRHSYEVSNQSCFGYVFRFYYTLPYVIFVFTPLYLVASVSVVQFQLK